MFGFLCFMLNALPDVTMIVFQQRFLSGSNGKQTKGLCVLDIYLITKLCLQHQLYRFKS